MDIAHKLKIKHKVGILSIIAIVGFAVFLFQQYQVQTQTQLSIEQIRDEYFPALSSVTNARNTIKNLDQALQTAVSTGDDELMDSAKNYLNLINEELNNLKRVSPQHAALVENLKRLLNSYQEIAFDIAASLIDGSTDFATLPARAKQSNEFLEQLNSEFKALVEASNVDFNQTVEETISSAQRSIHIGIGLGAVTILVL
ncbi:chemotaxis protein, partial [Vibrio sp. V10_P2A27P122]